MHYKVVCLKNHFLQIVNTYPYLVDLLYEKQNNSFETHQIELLFEPIGQGKEKLLNYIQQREDYSYFHGIHELNNIVTGEKIKIIMNEYDIDIDENNQNHVIFDVMKSFSQNFYMIKA